MQGLVTECDYVIRCPIMYILCKYIQHILFQLSCWWFDTVGWATESLVYDVLEIPLKLFPSNVE